MQTPSKFSELPQPLIDLINDELLTDPKAGRLLGVSPASICRYRMKGKCGVKLPWTWHGRRKVTTRACIDWWQREVQHAIRNHGAPSRASRRREVAPDLVRECEAEGV